MVTAKDKQPVRNLLLNYLHSIPESTLRKMRLLDFGSGPGNLIPFMQVQPKYFAVVDKSAGSLHKAASVAKQHAMNVDLVCGDIVNAQFEQKFDLIIASNSILPESREKVVNILSKLRSLLNRSGRLLAILPSFDTTIYLQDLKRQAYESDDEIVMRMDKDLLAYADDGKHFQCYHVLESIRKETRLAGLEIIGKLQKVYYPWGLSKRFGYGYYPQSKE